jgi:hypothetical protein
VAAALQIVSFIGWVFVVPRIAPVHWSGSAAVA